MGWNWTDCFVVLIPEGWPIQIVGDAHKGGAHHDERRRLPNKRGTARGRGFSREMTRSITSCAKPWNCSQRRGKRSQSRKHHGRTRWYHWSESEWATKKSDATVKTLVEVKRLPVNRTKGSVFQAMRTRAVAARKTPTPHPPKHCTNNPLPHNDHRRRNKNGRNKGSRCRRRR